QQRGDLARAWDLALEGVETARAYPSPDVEFGLTNLLGLIARRRGDYTQARRILHDALDMATKAGNDESTSYLLLCLAAVEVDDGEPAAALPFLRSAITRAHTTGAQGDLAESLELAARVLADHAAATAAVVLASSNALRESIGLAREPADQPAFEALQAQLEPAEPVDADAAVALALAALGTSAS
ncbi:MAG TPA: tetratricopeptide repeat protein, partial [Acidimicrobiales bacterium]|nr:tetratricopeptide repeat protein [Acidimicrobiales bacterium]